MIQDSFLKSFRETKSPFITNPYRFAAAESVGGWVELGRTTLGSEGDDIDVSSLEDKRYYMILGDMRDGTGDHGSGIILNNDTGTTYAVRRNAGGGGTDSTNTNLSSSGGYITDVRSNHNFNVTYLSNLSSKEKLWINQNVHQSTAGAGTSPAREEGVGKYTGTASAVNRFAYHNWHSGNYGTNSECVVLGWDESDTHTDNFWEELYSQELTSTGSLDTGVGGIAAKKYLWIQLHAARSVSGNQGFAFNGDYSNYSARYTTPSESNSTHTSHNLIQLQPDTASTGFVFTNAFIINNASNEKLVIAHTNYNKTTGAGTAPLRLETVAKWANTSDQITDVEIKRDSGTAQFLAGSCMKIWGAD